MCRIAGKVSKDGGDFADQVCSMLDVLRHGGPDDDGLCAEDNVTFGHRRLSIIQPGSVGHQPMYSLDAKLLITFNGEIYNYKILRDTLVAEGAHFRTQTDTEVVLVAYQHWGVGAFNKFQGIFAFALFDKRLNDVFLVRDQIGVKPLYYSLNRTELFFASEVRAFTAVNPNWREDAHWRILFLAFGSLPAPFTTLDEVVQLAPGHYLKLNVTKFTYEKHEYYVLPKPKVEIRRKAEAVAAMRDALYHALKKNLVSDVPVGIFLSGGIDSACLVMLADLEVDTIRTLSVNFDEPQFDEHHYQQLVLEKTNNVEHVSHRVSEQMFWHHLPELWQAMDQPSVDGVNTFFVARSAKAEGLKVALSGVGADEFFGGYSSFKRIEAIRWIRKLPCLRSLASVARFVRRPYGRFIYLALPGPIGDYLCLRGIFQPSEIAGILGIDEKEVWLALEKVVLRAPGGLVPKEYASFLESRIYLVNQLLKDTDSMGMWHSLEIRTPFLDTSLLETLQKIDPKIKYNSSNPKFLITAPLQSLLPQRIVGRKKKGFTFPFPVWMKSNKENLQQLLPNNAASNAVHHGFIQGKNHWSKPWTLAVLNQFDKKKSYKN